MLVEARISKRLMKKTIYGAGSRLIETTAAAFSYDKEGNLVEKVERKVEDMAVWILRQ